MTRGALYAKHTRLAAGIAAMPDRPAVPGHPEGVPAAEGRPAPGADPVYEKPEGWPDKCGNCGASWEHIGFDYADGFNCRACGACDSDE